MSDEPAGAGAPESVRPLELFFDLVFVFTITQVAAVLTEMPTLLGLGRMAVLLTLIWWMYGGYAWLTNALDLDRAGPRLLLLTGMAGFFLMSITVPRAAESGPWALVFGASYLLVVTVHLVGFLGTSGRRGILRVAPLNLVSAVVVLAAGVVPPHARFWVWALAAVTELSTPLITGVGEFTVGVGHFVERHGLAVLIVLGESIAEVGVAASGKGHLGTAIAGALLALTLAAAMWWLYFGREQHDSQIWLEHVPSDRRPRAAVYAFGYAYYLIILGIAVAAVGMQKAIDSFGHAAVDLSATLLPLGTTLYLAGLGCFHRTLSDRWPSTRLAAALAVAVLVTPAALWLSGAAALGAASVLLLMLVTWETRHTRTLAASDGINLSPLDG